MTANGTVIIKLGGGVLQKTNSLKALASALGELIEEKRKKFVLVHGGGSQADRLHKRLDVPIQKVQGRRITDRNTLEIAKMVYAGSLNTDLVSILQQRGITAIGLTGADGSLIRVTRRPPVNISSPGSEDRKVDFGYVGNIKQINTELLEKLTSENMVPVVGCLGIDTNGQVYNVNADTVASTIASALQAESLIYTTEAGGVFPKPDSGEMYNHLPLKEAKQMIESQSIQGGMIPKIQSAGMALGNQVKRILIIGPHSSKKKWMESILNSEHGTCITGNPNHEQLQTEFLSSE